MLSEYVRARLDRVMAGSCRPAVPAGADHVSDRPDVVPRRARADLAPSPNRDEEPPLPEPSDDVLDPDGPVTLTPTPVRPAGRGRPVADVPVAEVPVAEAPVAEVPVAEVSIEPGSPVRAGELARASEFVRVGEFVRAHLLVVGVIAAVAVAAAGYAVLRAQAIPLSSPVQAQSPTARPSAAAAASGMPSGTGPTAGPSASRPAATILVHVVGAVRRPGVVSLPAGSRVTNALDAAGGLRSDADPGRLNLAQVLTDGQQVVVGTDRDPAGEVRGANGSDGSGGPGGSGTDGSPAGGASAGAPTQPVDLNAATTAQLETLPGVGPVTAAAIVAWREQHGRFTRVAELQEIDGIGPKTFARLEPHVRV